MLTISRISKKTVQTKDYGEKEKWGVQFKEKGNTWFDSFIGKWNADWKVGTQIEVMKSQIKEREYNGKTYYTITAPPEARGFQLPEWVSTAIRDLQARVARLEENVPQEPDYEEPIFDDEEMPDESSVNIKDIPFN